MASTGSTEGYYSAENFMQQGSTRLEIGGELNFMANSMLRFTASTIAEAGTVPVGTFSVINSSTDRAATLANAKLGAFTAVCHLGASSSGTHTVSCTSDYIINGGSTATGLSYAVNTPGIMFLYCPSTSVFLIHKMTLGSSDVTVSGTT